MQESTRNYSIDKFIINPSAGRKTSPIDLGASGTTITDFYYYESILNETIKCSVTYSDIGKYSVADGVTSTVIDGMPLEGGEDVDITFKDMNHDATLKLKMQVRSINPLSKDTVRSLATLDLISEEGIRNYKKVVNKRYDGKISDTVTKICREFLQTEKDLDIETTDNNYNIISNNWHPFYILHWLSGRSIPNIQGAKGNTAGFFFFETSEGFKFKSIDGMLSETGTGGNKKNVKKFIYNQTVDLPVDYDAKILELDPPNPSGDIIRKLEAGTYSTRTILFDPFDCYYEVINPNSQSSASSKASQENLQKAGKNLPKINPKFNIEGQNKDFSKTKYHLIDRGSLPSGDTKQQIEKSKDQNFDPKNILNQSSMRYNQLFSSKTTITIYGDLSLHAGDLIWIDPPELSNKQTQGLDNYLGGYYIIADLCHYYNLSTGCFTKITAVRDSTGKKGNPTYNPF